ncbi:MAG: hypothetical protein HY556_10110 [Euryarchaeota archaeon]|nr:hypothetical protein [Euryarchaeota archaeon]
MRKRFTVNDTYEFLGSKVQGLAIEQESLAADAHVTFSVYRIEGDEVVWSTTVTGFFPVGASSSIGVLSNGEPVELLFVVAAHTASAGRIRIGIPITSIPPKVSDNTTAGSWLAHGPSTISFYLLPGPRSSTSTFADGQPVSSGVMERGTPFSPTGAAAPPFLSLSTRHSGGASGVEFALSLVSGAGGAAVVNATWSGDEAQWFSTRATPPNRPAGHVAAGFYEGETGTEVAITGALAVPSIRLVHVSVPFDLATLDLKHRPYFSGAGMTVPATSGGTCVSAPSGGVCA